MKSYVMKIEEGYIYILHDDSLFEGRVDQEKAECFLLFIFWKMKQ